MSKVTRSGYAVTIKGFIVTDPKDLAGQAQILDTILAAQKGDKEAIATVIEKMAPQIEVKQQRRQFDQ